MKVEAIVNIVNEMNNRDTFIDSAASVVKILEDTHGIEAKTREVRKILRDELNMRWACLTTPKRHLSTKSA